MKSIYVEEEEEPRSFKGYLEKYKYLLVTAALFLISYGVRSIDVGLKGKEFFINLPFYLVYALLVGLLASYIINSLKDKTLLSLLIYPLIAALILIHIIIPPVYVLQQEYATQIIDQEEVLAKLVLMDNQCENETIIYTIAPLYNDKYKELRRDVKLSVTGCDCKNLKGCEEKIEEAILANELLNETRPSTILTSFTPIWTIQGSYLAMPIIEEGCRYNSFVKIVIIPSWKHYTREGSQICFD